VAAYALLFGVSYSGKTYFSLLPLTLGVMLACSFDMSASNVTGLACAFGSALVFVTSNIFFKKVMPSTEKGTAGTTASAAHKLDKLNLLFYSSTMAFVLMIPIWLWTDLPALWAGADAPAGHPSHGGHGHSSSLAWAFFANGTVHFAQNAIAFIILASTSPVTYSIASLVKRVAVICIAISWFAQPVHPIQAVGICLTSVGLWLYNGAKGDVAAGERRVRRVERARDLALPSTKAEVAAEGGMLGNSTRMTTMMADPAPPPVYVASMSMGSGSGSASAPPPPPTGVRGRRGSVRVPLPPPIVTRVNLPNAQSIVAVGGGNTPTDAKSPATGLEQRPVSYPSPPDSLDSPPPEHAYDLQYTQAEEGPLRATAVAMR
jgi:solute carrier family 35 protein E1